MKRPKFNEARGAAVITGSPPFDFEGVSMRTFPLRAEMQVLQRNYQAAEATFKAHEDALRNKQPVSTFIEGLASKHEITDQLSNINAQGTPEVVGSIAQQRYTVDIKKAPQENIFRFLYDLETSGYPVSVDQAAFKSQKTKDGVMMNLTLELMVLSVSEG